MALGRNADNLLTQELASLNLGARVKHGSKDIFGIFNGCGELVKRSFAIVHTQDKPAGPAGEKSTKWCLFQTRPHRESSALEIQVDAYTEHHRIGERGERHRLESCGGPLTADRSLTGVDLLVK